MSPDPAKPDFPTARLIVVLGPVIAVVAFTAAMAGVAAILGWNREQMLLIAAAAGCAAALPALLLVYRLRADRLDAQRALENIEARVGGIVASAMDAIVTADASQRIVQFNAAAERVFRWPRSAVLGQPLDMLIPERFRQAHHGHIERFGRTATTSRDMGTQMVLHGLRADGTEFPIEASISHHAEDGRILFTVILRDVTRRVLAEDLLARSEARLRGILDSAMDAIITVDERQHVVLFNKAAEAVFGCPREEAVGAPLSWFIPERFREAHGAHLKRFGVDATVSRRMSSQRIVYGLRRNGEEFPLDASISKVGEAGQLFFTVILRDVTERQRNELALRNSREEIRELALAASTAREHEKSRVARELHDELGQQLTALKIDVGWLRENLASAPAHATAKLAAMQLQLDATVASTRRIASDLRPLMLDDLGLAAASDWLVQNFTQRTGVACEIATRGDLDFGDPHATAVFRVLQESLTNAAKHSGATQVEVNLERDNDTVTLTVRDNGRGFTTGEGRKPGSYGLLGLRERATLLRGEVRVESWPGGGTVVELRIPTPTPEANP